jgi:hypothetical protein
VNTESLSQVPTDDELFAYLVGHLRRSAVAWHLEDSEFRPDLLDAGFVASLEAYSRIGGGELIDRLIDTLFDALRRLNATPRSDELWAGTNGRPTLFKLRDHIAIVLGATPGDTLALWTQIALSIVHGSSTFGAKQWRRLHHEGLDDVRWPILAALVTELNSAPTGNELVELLDRTERRTPARVFLATFDVCDDPWILRWRDDVDEALAEE